MSPLMSKGGTYMREKIMKKRKHKRNKEKHVRSKENITENTNIE